MARGLSLSLPLSVLAASAALTGCGAGSRPATKGTHGLTVGGTSADASASAKESARGRHPGAPPLTLEEMREYDANEARCHDDGGRVRNVGTVKAYCSFPVRSNDFPLIESSHEKAPAGAEE